MLRCMNMKQAVTMRQNTNLELNQTLEGVGPLWRGLEKQLEDTENAQALMKEEKLTLKFSCEFRAQIQQMGEDLHLSLEQVHSLELSAPGMHVELFRAR